MDSKHDKVCLVVLVIIVTLFFLLQTEFAEDDPGIQITYADEVSIHNCLGLPSISTMGPSDVPKLADWWYVHTCDNYCN